MLLLRFQAVEFFSISVVKYTEIGHIPLVEESIKIFESSAELESTRTDGRLLIDRDCSSDYATGWQCTPHKTRETNAISLDPQQPLARLRKRN